MLNSIKTLQLMDNPLVEKKMTEDEKKEEFNFDYTFSLTSYTLVASDDFQFECQIDMQKKMNRFTFVPSNRSIMLILFCFCFTEVYFLYVIVEYLFFSHP